MNKITIVLPAYNEEENIEALLIKWDQQRTLLEEEHGLGLRIVVIDDGSSDETAAIVERRAEDHPGIILIRHTENQGLGAGVRTGIGYFLEQCGDSPYLCIMDADNTQDPVYIGSMLDAIRTGNRHVVIASRYREGSQVEGVSPLRLVMSSGARLVFTVLLRVPGVRDYTCGYRLYERNKLQEAADRFGEKLIEENGFTCMVELLYKLYCCGAVFAEIPFHLRYDRKLGGSKMSVVRTSLNSWIVAMRLKKMKRTG
jgi:dolichol-phosphate mannosyltransferase